MTKLSVKIIVDDPDNEWVVDTLEGRMTGYRLDDLKRELERNHIPTTIYWERKREDL